MSKNLKVHINHMAILLAPISYRALIQEYLSQKLISTPPENYANENCFEEAKITMKDKQD